ncbi:MAG: glycosyltransferase [Acidobacteriota bacterium]|nr:glycosyltransferase [Acidobacteriota bacterium]
MHFGIVSPPVPGHLNPFCALGRELMGRGHRVTVFHMADVRERILREGLEFVDLGAADHPEGTLPASLAQLGKLKGWPALRFTIGEVARGTAMFCRDLPAALREANIDVVLVDQTEPAGSAVAQLLGLPHVTICNALILHREPDVPPPFSPWSYRPNAVGRIRNRVGYFAADRVLAPVRRVIHRFQREWGVPEYGDMSESHSSRLQISQQFAAFDFPRRNLPACFHFVGPLRNQSPAAEPFPWEKINGKPLIFASLGTLQTGKQRIFRMFAEACEPLDVQLAIAHGGGLNGAEIAALPGKPLVVPFAPQVEVLSRARLALTHAGLNTVLDALSNGVPLVAIPITFEQPGIAARVQWTGCGEVVDLNGLTATAMRQAIVRVLNEPRYSQKAAHIAQSAKNVGGVSKAADLILGLSSS